MFNATVSFSGEIVDGKYIGWKKISDITPYDKNEVWYHEHKLIIKGKTVSIEATPISIKNGRLVYSESDGGFYTYKGQIFVRSNKNYIKLRIIDCDYCPKPVSGKWPEREYPLHSTNPVSFEFDSVLYILEEAK